MPKDAEEQLDQMVDDVIRALRNPAVLRRVFRRALVGPDERLLAQAIREAIGFDVYENALPLARAYKELAPSVEFLYRREGSGPNFQLVAIQKTVEVGR